MVAGGGPGRPRSAQSQEAILAATTELLLELGYQRLTVEGVAARAGVGKTTIYRWWPTKAALVIDAIAARLPEPARVITGDTRTDLRAVVTRISASLSGPFGLVLPALAADLVQDAEAASRLAALLGPRRAANAAFLFTAAGRSELPHDIDVTVLLDLVAGAVIYRRLVGRDIDSNLTDQLTDLMVDGRLPRTS